MQPKRIYKHHLVILSVLCSLIEYAETIYLSSEYIIAKNVCQIMWPRTNMVFKDEELKRNLILNKFTWKESMKMQVD